jgi:biopolymer transport protein ExbB
MSAFSHFITTEWYFAVPMFLMSFTAVTLVVWRILLNLDAKTDLNKFLPKFQKVLDEEGAEAALAFSRSQPGVIAKKLYPAGLETRGQGVSAMKRSMASVIELEIVPDLNFLLALILAIAKIATMVGLLGTVISMINTFSAISAEQNASGVASHSKEIGLALFATALGLVTAIPLVFSHVLFKDWIARYELKMQSAAQKLLVMLQEKTDGAASGRPVASKMVTAQVG